MDKRFPALQRQLLLFLVVGFAQLGVDSLAYIALSAAGVPVVAANIAGRLVAVSLGFWAHGRFTFAGPEGPRLHGRALRRFVVVWLVLTAASSLAVAAAEHLLGLQASWLAKPCIEAALAVASFVLMRLWVFEAGGRR